MHAKCYAYIKITISYTNDGITHCQKATQPYYYECNDTNQSIVLKTINE